MASSQRPANSQAPAYPTLFAQNTNKPITTSKLVLLGDSAVGKSSLALRFVKKEFIEDLESTIGAAYLTQTIEVSNHKRKFEIWDTAGQERYRSLAPMYYRNATSAVVVYDVTDRKSFLNAKSWVNELEKRQEQNTPILIALVGNKLDLAEENRHVDTREAEAYANEKGLLFFEASAKNNHNVDEIFKTLAEKLFSLSAPVVGTSLDGHHVIDLADIAQTPKRRGCC